MKWGYLMKNKKLFITIFFSALAMGANYLINFFLTPYITENIGADAYGFVSLSKTFISYAGIITIALNSYATRFIAVAYHRNETKKCNKYFSSVFYANLVLSLILLVLFSVGSFNISHILNVPVTLVDNVKLLFFLTGISFSITTCFSVFASSAYIKNQLDKTNIFKGLSYIVEAILLIILFYLFEPSVWFVSLGAIISSIIIGLSNFILYKHYTPDINIERNLVSSGAVKELVGSGIWNSLNSLGNTLNSGLDLLITNLMLTPLAMGQLAIAKTISSMFYALFQLLSQPFQPIFLKDYSENNIDKLINDLKFSMVVCGMFSNLAFAGFVAVGLDYYRLWIPTQNVELVWILTIITIFGSVIEGAVFPLYYIYTLTIKNKIPCIVTIVGGLVNVIGMYLLLKFTDMGVYAIVITTAVIMTFINFVFNPIYMSKVLGISKKTFYMQLFRHVVSCVVMTIVFCFIGKINLSLTWISFIFKVLICCVIGIPIHMLITIEKPIYFLKSGGILKWNLKK